MFIALAISNLSINDDIIIVNKKLIIVIMTAVDNDLDVVLHLGKWLLLNQIQILSKFLLFQFILLCHSLFGDKSIINDHT